MTLSRGDLKVVSKSIFLCWIVAGLSCLFANKSYAQLYPVQITPQLVPPYSVYLSDYATPGSEKLRVIVLQRDLTQPAYQLRLTMSVEWNGKVIMRTSRSFNPPPINIDPGIPTIISGADIAPYLNSRNIDFLGYSREQYERTRALPEGSYRIFFTAYDYRRQDVQVSNEGSSFYYLSKNEPPLINFPACGTKIPLKDPQQIIFSWLPRNTASPNSVAETEYEFSLYETRPAGRNPNDVVLSTQPIFRTRVDFTQLVYGPAEPLLFEGMKYVWRIQAIDKNGRDSFRNNGFSEVCTFTYAGGDATFDIGVVKNLQAVGETENRGKISWEAANYDSYKVYYKKTGSGYEWFSSDVTNTELKLFGLEPDTEYETRVQVKKNGVFGPYSEIIKFRTTPIRVIQCGQENGTLAQGDTGKPLMAAHMGMTIDVDGMEVMLSDVVPLGSGWYKGMGTTTTKLLGASFFVKFDRLFIDDNHIAGLGKVEFLTKGVAELVQQQLANHQQKEEQKQQEQNRDQWTDVEFQEKIFKYDIIIADISFENGTVTIIDSEGNSFPNTEIPQMLVDAPEKAIIIEDKNGDQYVVQKDPSTGETKVTKVGGGGLSTTPISIASTKEKKLVAEFLKRFENQIASVLDPIREPAFPRGAGPLADVFSELPSCMPEDQDQLVVIKEYLFKTSRDEKRLDAFMNALYQNQSDKQTIISIASKVELSGNQKFEDVLSSEDIQKVEQSLCSRTVEEAKIEFVTLWWRAPYWERAAKILKEHFEDVGLYEDVTVVCQGEQCKTIGIIKITEDANATVEVTFSSSITDADTWTILSEHGVDFWEGRSVTLESWKDRFWNYMAMKDDNLYQGKGWESKTLQIFADVLMAAPGTVEGWITGKHWRTGDELAMWEHVLGILDVVPTEAIAKAGITALVIKIGGKFIDVTKFTQPVKSFILSAYSSGLKLLIKSKDEVIIFTSNGTQQIGRLLNGVLQELYWVYGGERIIARLAGVKYLDESNKLVDGSIEIFEQGGKVGANVKREVGRVIYLTAKINGVTVVRIIGGSNGKVALIGRRMPYIEEVADALKKLGKDVEIFDKQKAFGGQGFNNWTTIKTEWDDAVAQFGVLDSSGNKILPYDKVKKTLWYKENERWAKWIKESGFDIYDLGDNPGSVRNAPDRSAFYDLEKTTIFND